MSIDLDAIRAEIARTAALIYETGKSEERAAVVAWLRAQQVGTRYTASQLLAAIADAIEQGEHVREGEE